MSLAYSHNGTFATKAALHFFHPLANLLELRTLLRLDVPGSSLVRGARVIRVARIVRVTRVRKIDLAGSLLGLLISVIIRF
jgi:hypothetical protein